MVVGLHVRRRIFSYMESTLALSVVRVYISIYCVNCGYVSELEVILTVAWARCISRIHIIIFLAATALRFREYQSRKEPKWASSYSVLTRDEVKHNDVPIRTGLSSFATQYADAQRASPPIIPHSPGLRQISRGCSYH